MPSSDDPVEERRIAVRAYTIPPPPKKSSYNNDDDYVPPPDHPSAFSLTFDTETTNDAAQQLRFGTYQLRNRDVLLEEGFFYHPSLSQTDMETLRDYRSSHPERVLE